MSQLLSSKIVIVEEEPTIRALPVVQTGICVMEAVTERGPVGLGPPTSSFPEWASIYGGYTANADGALAAQGFFDNGGQILYTIRAVHYTDITSPATKQSAAATLTLNTAALIAAGGVVTGTLAGPYDLEPGDTLSFSVSGGGTLTATFTATAAQRISSAEPFALVNNQTLLISINGGAVQTITFVTADFVAIGAATAAEVAAKINAVLVGGRATVSGATVVILTDRRGTSASVNISGGSANAALGFTTGAVAGTGNVADVDAVTVAEIKTIVEAAVAGVLVTNVSGRVRVTTVATGPAVSIQVLASSSADDELGLDNLVHTGNAASTLPTLQIDAKYDGSYANDIVARIGTASSGLASEFNFSVQDNGVIVESFPNLTMDPATERYAPTIINGTLGSKLIVVTDLLALVASPGDNPATGNYGPMTGGNDGLSGLADTDFIGNAAGGTGLRAADVVPDMSLLIVPGRATAAMHQAMYAYCELTRSGLAFAILDPPANQTAAQMVTYVTDTAALYQASEFAAIYWPRVKILNPSKSVFGSAEQLVVAPSGILAGIYVRTDGATPGGVYEAPAGIEKGQLLGVVGFETNEVLDEAKRDLIYPKHINPLTADGGLRVVDGSRNLKRNGNFPSIPERRGAIFIEQSVKRGLTFAKHKNNTQLLRQSVARTVQTFLISQMKNGAFRTRDPKTAFFVDFGDSLNPPSEVFAGRLNGRVGIATNKPTEFVVIKFSQDTRALEAELAQ